MDIKYVCISYNQMKKQKNMYIMKWWCRNSYEELASKDQLVWNNYNLGIKLKKGDVGIISRLKINKSACWNLSGLCDSIEKGSKRGREEGITWNFNRAEFRKGRVCESLVV